VGIPDFGASARVGAQLDDAMAVLADLGFTLGPGGGGAIGCPSSFAWFLHATLLLERAFFSRLLLAGGPMLFFGGWTQTRGPFIPAGAAPGLHLRVGWKLLPLPPQDGRHHLVLAFDSKVILGPGATPPGQPQPVQFGDSSLAWAPALILGYEAR
jgi:hypothetical protein